MLSSGGLTIIEHPKDYDAALAEAETWEAMLFAGVFVDRPPEDPFILASGLPVTLKANMDVLERRPRERAVILGHMAAHPSIQDADVLLYVPDGMRVPTNELGAIEMLGKPVAQTERVPGAQSRYEFRFTSERDRKLALDAARLAICEDVFTTGGSADGVIDLLNPETQDISAVAMLLRGSIKPEYRERARYHALVERYIPSEAETFLASLTPLERRLYEQGRQLTA